MLVEAAGRALLGTATPRCARSSRCRRSRRPRHVEDVLTHVSFAIAASPRSRRGHYVVIGSGREVLRRVDAQPRRCERSLVEAGACAIRRLSALSTYDRSRSMDDGRTARHRRALWPIVQRRCMGGTTVSNSAICVRTPADVFDPLVRRGRIGGAGGGHGALRDRVWPIKTCSERELSVEEVPPEARGRSNELAFPVARERAFREGHYMRRYVWRIGSGQCLQGCARSRSRAPTSRWSPRSSRRVSSLVGARRAHRDRGTRATGVRGHFVHPHTRARGATFFVRAKKAVIVAASVPTRGVLMRSAKPRLGMAFARTRHGRVRLLRRSRRSERRRDAGLGRRAFASIRL